MTEVFSERLQSFGRHSPASYTRFKCVENNMAETHALIVIYHTGPMSSVHRPHQISVIPNLRKPRLISNQRCWWVGGWIMLIVGFQPLMVISPTASWIRWCMQVSSGVGDRSVYCDTRLIQNVNYQVSSGSKPVQSVLPYGLLSVQTTSSVDLYQSSGAGNIWNRPCCKHLTSLW